MQDSEKNRDVIKIPIRLWRIPFHYYQSGGGSRFYKYFDDVRALVGMWAMAHPLFENLLNKGPFKIFFFKNFTSVGPPTFKMPPRALQQEIASLKNEIKIMPDLA